MSDSDSKLLTISVFLTGMAAGLSADRSIVQLPAFRRTGLDAWVAYSRHADLENGLFYYPTLALGGSILTIAAAWRMSDRGSTIRRRARLSRAAAVSAAIALAATSQAAPNMWRLREISTADHDSVDRAYRGFRFWHGVRSVALTLTFAFGLAALRER
jgi:hypothetical protein